MNSKGLDFDDYTVKHASISLLNFNCKFGCLNNCGEVGDTADC